MADTSGDGDQTPFFIGSIEQLQAFSDWIDEFTRAVSNRSIDNLGIQSYEVDLKALNKVLARGADHLGSLNVVAAQECHRLIRDLHSAVIGLISPDLSELLDALDDENSEWPAQAEQDDKLCQDILRFAVPHFQRLGVRIREAIVSIGQAGPAADSLGQKPVAALPLDPDPPRTAEKIRPPSDSAIACYRTHLLTGLIQEEIAKRLEMELKQSVSQGQVSKWIKEVKKWIAAGNVLPDMPSPNRAQPDAMDPRTLELGARQDGLTPRQRAKRSEDSDD